MTFRIGQKVVCVDKSRGYRNLLGDWYDDPDLVIGSIYTVTWVGVLEDTPVISIAEIPVRRAPPGHKARNEGRVTAFGADRFRPLVERKTDAGMAILREILDRESHQDRVPEKVRR